jgi:hypothetical protein
VLMAMPDRGGIPSYLRPRVLVEPNDHNASRVFVAHKLVAEKHVHNWLAFDALVGQVALDILDCKIKLHFARCIKHGFELSWISMIHLSTVF